MCVVKPVMRRSSTRTHFEWVPGRQASPLPPIASSTPNTCVSSPRITSATPASSVVDRPGTSFTCAQSNSIPTSADAISGAPAGQGR